MRAYPEYPTCYAKSERDARTAMNEALNDTLAAISPARNPKPSSDADFAEFLIESIAKNSEPNIAVPKFVRAQILFLAEYDPIVRQGINRILWELYNRDAGELEGLSIEEAE